jgi:hypothetical protein
MFCEEMRNVMSRNEKEEPVTLPAYFHGGLGDCVT